MGTGNSTLHARHPRNRSYHHQCETLELHRHGILQTDPVQLTLRVLGFMSEWRIYANDTKTKCPGSMFMHKADKEYYVKRMREYDRIVMRLHQGVDDISERNTLSNKIANNIQQLRRPVLQDSSHQ